MSSSSTRPTVLFVAWQSNRLANGGITSLTEILRGIADRIDRVIIAISEGMWTERWRAMGCEVQIWEAERPPELHGLELVMSRARRLPHVVLQNVRMARFVRERGVRVVHCNDMTSFWFAAPGAKLAGARVLFNIRDIFPPEEAYGPRWRATHLVADHIVCLSAEMRDQVLERMALPPPLRGRTKQAEVTFVYSIVDLEVMRPVDAAGRAAARAKLELPPDRFIVSNVGAFCDKKNQLGFIEHVVPRLAAEIPGVLVAFAGDCDPSDEYTARCIAKVDELGLRSSVAFVGFVKDAALAYQASDLTALTSRYEGLPRCMIESLACGVPCVAFDVTSVREFLEARDTGVALRWGDYDGMATAIARLAQDRQELERLGRRARDAAVEAFDRDRAIARYLAFYTA